MRRLISAAVVFLVFNIALCPLRAEPLAEKYLIDGKLAEGERALNEHLKANPRDDEARFGLGVVQFLQAFENLGGSLYKYGLSTERTFARQWPEVRQLFPQNPAPEQFRYADARRILQTFVDDVIDADATLAEVKDADVKLPLHLGQFKLTLFDPGRPLNAAMVLGRMEAAVPRNEVERFVITFDRGDVSWLRGYCHVVAALGEVMLAIDGQELFECTAHLFFEKVDSPHEYLQRNRLALDEITSFDRPLISDVIAYIHLMLRLPVKEPARMRTALDHLEVTAKMAKEMWRFYLAETDDDNEWIPNPNQQGVLRVAVDQAMVDAWLASVDEFDLILQGKCLVPFWRGDPTARGVNVRRVFTEPPKEIDIVLWVQGTAATPYLEDGRITKLADQATLGRINDTFGGWRFFGFAFWFN
jgi:hypothetical protein